MSFMLKTSEGRAVRVSWQHREAGGVQFAVENGDGTSSMGSEAVICRGDDLLWTQEHVVKAFNRLGFDWVKMRFKSESYLADSVCEVYCPEYFRNGGFGPPRGDPNYGWVWLTTFHPDMWRWTKESKTLDGHAMSHADWERMYELNNSLTNWGALVCKGYITVLGKQTDLQTVLGVIGEGQTVTTASLESGCAKGSTRPRLMVGDAVTWTAKGTAKTGVISSFVKDGVRIKTEGKDTTVAFHLVSQAQAGSSLPTAIEPAIEKNFQEVDTDRFLFRAAVKVIDNISIPMFPTEEQKNQTQRYENAITCTCPLCGWQMVLKPVSYFDNRQELECAFCRQTAMLIHRTDTEMVSRLNRLPAKNQFAIRESRCCANCGLFQFETGRQGKRSTGYCRRSYQCLQAFNVCDWWFPQDPERYAQAMKQHCTNLGYGVDDNRNTTRNELRDVVYAEADHEAQKKRAEAAKRDYIAAYRNLMDSLRAKGEKLPLIGDTVEEDERKRYRDAIEGGVE